LILGAVGRKICRIKEEKMRNPQGPGFFFTFALSASLALTGAVQARDLAQAAGVTVAPQSRPWVTLTGFTPALRCMDQLFLAFGQRGTLLTSGGLPDETGKVRAGTKEMMITAISRMSSASGAFEFIDFHSVQDDLGRLMAARGDRPARLPDYYIRGSITQMDENVIRKSSGVGVSVEAESRLLDPLAMVLGAEKTDVFDVLGLDLSVGHAATRRILPVTVTSNTLLMQRSGQSLDGANAIGKVGFSFALDQSQTEGVGAATRALVELSLIEALGKLTQVPYWRCLQSDQGNPLVRQQVQTQFDRLKPADQVRFVQRKLGGSLRYYLGPIDGVMNPELADAMARYQTEQSLPVTGRLDFALYARLLDDIDHSLAPMPAPNAPDVSAQAR
jgi:curli biogenesis system outer membrane secretion channel CsgG